MSLDYNLTKIEDRNVHFPPNTQSVEILGTLNQKVNGAIWATIAVQMGEITADNADEWFDRYVFWNKLMGFEPNEYTLTREDVHHLVGLKTNVWPNMDHAAWLSRMWDFVKEGRI
jgi:hypothetical protein